MLNSLKIKILTLVTLILVLIISTVAYINFSHQKEMLHEIANRNTSVLIETIKSSIGNAMYIPGATSSVISGVSSSACRSSCSASSQSPASAAISDRNPIA